MILLRKVKMIKKVEQNSNGLPGKNQPFKIIPNYTINA